MKRLFAWAVLPAFLLALPVSADDENEKPKRQSSPKDAKVYIVSPQDGKVVKKPVKVVFGLTGMGICPAGIIADGGVPYPDTGHHHLLVDFKELPPMDVALPIDQPNCLHYGKGQTEAIVELSPGTHTLQLVLADYAHVPHNPPVVSKKITITVE